MTLTKKTSLIILIVGYALAGINHFVHPAFYVNIIPAYIPYPKLMNIVSGVFELIFAAMLMFTQTRRIAAWGIILLLAAFLPVHIQMVVDAPFRLGHLHVVKLGAWIRLFFQPVLMLWAGWHTRR